MYIKFSDPKNECPRCQLKKFKAVLDSNNNIIHPSVGVCDDIINCEYTFLELDYYFENPPKRIPAYIPTHDFERSLDNYSNNYFVIFLKREFQGMDTNTSIKDYYLGTSLKQEGASVFWYIDGLNNICDGYLWSVNPQTGRKMGEKTSIHKLYFKQEKRPEKCFFGEHLVDKYPEKLKAIAKDEIEAVIGSIVYPEYLWLATSKHIRKEERSEYWPETIWYPEAGFEKLRNFSDRSKPLQFWPRDGSTLPYSLNVIRRGL